jgi:hypothetical protein
MILTRHAGTVSFEFLVLSFELSATLAEFRISDFGFAAPKLASLAGNPQSAWRCRGGPRREDHDKSQARGTRLCSPRGLSQHRRRNTISLESTIKTLLPLGKSRRARPDVAFRGRVGGGWGRGKRSSRASPRPNVARRRAKGAQRWEMVGPTSACARRVRHPPTRGRGRSPRTAGTETGLGRIPGDGSDFLV